MTDFDLFIVSLIINIVLVIQNRIQHRALLRGMEAMAMCIIAIEKAADGTDTFVRTNGRIVLKEQEKSNGN